MSLDINEANPNLVMKSTYIGKSNEVNYVEDNSYKEYVNNKNAMKSIRIASMLEQRESNPLCRNT